MGTRLKNIYIGMKQRCINIQHRDYPRYGGRGIKICNEWLESFDNFYNWAINNGYKDNLSIDRINNNGNYCPENCRWATFKEQNNNTSRNLILKINGEEKTLSQWSEKLA